MAAIQKVHLIMSFSYMEKCLPLLLQNDSIYQTAYRGRHWIHGFRESEVMIELERNDVHTGVE